MSHRNFSFHRPASDGGEEQTGLSVNRRVPRLRPEAMCLNGAFYRGSAVKRTVERNTHPHTLAPPPTPAAGGDDRQGATGRTSPAWAPPARCVVRNGNSLVDSRPRPHRTPRRQAGCGIHPRTNNRPTGRGRNNEHEEEFQTRFVNQERLFQRNFSSVSVWKYTDGSKEWYRTNSQDELG